MTDIVIFILSLYFLIRGAARGFMNSLTMPISIIVATFLSFIYFQITKDVVFSLLIGLIGPLLLNLLLKFLLRTWAEVSNTQIKPNFLSRLGGATVTFAWGWIFITFALIFLAMLPPWGKTLTDIHNDVTSSSSYFFAKPLGEKFFTAVKPNATATTSQSSSVDAKSLADDPRFQKVLQDPDIQKEIDAHDMVKLMSNPKMLNLVQQLMSDPTTMKKVMALYNSQTVSQAAKNP